MNRNAHRRGGAWLINLLGYAIIALTVSVEAAE
jgi:hypothetical protein